MDEQIPEDDDMLMEGRAGGFRRGALLVLLIAVLAGYTAMVVVALLR